MKILFAVLNREAYMIGINVLQQSKSANFELQISDLYILYKFTYHVMRPPP